jgi:lysophospholipase L1-like esterase
MKDICAENKRIIWDQLKLDFNPDFFAADGVHPSDEGYQRIAEFAFEGLKARNLV